MDRIGGTSSELLQLLAAHASRAAVRGALEKGMSPLLILLRCGVAALLAAQSVAVAEQNGYLVTNGVVPKGKHHDQRGTEERNEGTEQQALYTTEALEDLLQHRRSDGYESGGVRAQGIFTGRTREARPRGMLFRVLASSSEHICCSVPQSHGVSSNNLQHAGSRCGWHRGEWN